MKMNDAATSMDLIPLLQQSAELNSTPAGGAAVQPDAQANIFHALVTLNTQCEVFKRCAEQLGGVCSTWQALYLGS